MSLTGLFLITFLIIHVTINGMIWFNDGGETFSHWGHFMGTNPIIRTLEIGLVIGFLLHIYDGLMLWYQNHNARPVKYAYTKPSANSKWYSRSMGLLGTIVLLFLILHLADFWLPNRSHQGFLLGEEIDLYKKMQDVFSNLWVVVIYVLGCISLGYHLAHGFQSAFRTLGVTNKRYCGLISSTGMAFSIIVPLAFAMMPISFYLGWLS